MRTGTRARRPQTGLAHGHPKVPLGVQYLAALALADRDANCGQSKVRVGGIDRLRPSGWARLIIGGGGRGGS